MMHRWKLDEYEIFFMWKIKERALTKVTSKTSSFHIQNVVP